MEIKADVILKATRVDGIYDADPELVKEAQVVHRSDLSRRAAQKPKSNGRHGDFPVHGQWYAYRCVQYESSRKHSARVVRGARWFNGNTRLECGCNNADS